MAQENTAGNGVAEHISAAWCITKPFQTDVFIENLGQFDSWLPSAAPVIYVVNSSDKIFFSRNGLTFRLDKYDMSEEKTEYDANKEHLKKKAHKKKKEQKKYESEEGEEIKREKLFIKMHWEHCNPDVAIIPSEAVSGYYTFGEKGYENIRANGYSMITYQNLYNGIDAEYILHKSGGIKYRLIVHPGADTRNVAMHYDGDIKKITTDEQGNVLIKTRAGTIVDHAPVCFYDESGQPIKSAFVLKGNTVTFNLQHPDPDQTVIIDPWTVTPTSLDTGYFARDIEVDDNGNIYVMGGGFPYKLSKYSSSGNLLWTYTKSDNSYGFYAKFCITPTSGSCYIPDFPITYDGDYTYHPIVTKVNTYGNLVETTAPLGDNSEMWTLAYNELNGKMIGLGGGIFTSKNLYYFPDTTLSNCQIKNSTDETCNANDLASGVLDNDGTLYYVSASSVNDCQFENYIFKNTSSDDYETPSLSVAAKTALDECFTPAGVSGFSTDLSNCNVSTRANCLALNNNNLFSYDGKILKAWNKSTMELLDSAIVNSNYGQGRLRTHEGIASDLFNNIYVGGESVVHHYFFNGTTFSFIDDISVSEKVYDIKTEGICKIVVAGKQFVSSVDISNNINVKVQPANQLVCDGSSAQFSADMYGSSALTFQWQLSTDNGSTWANLSNGGVYSNISTATMNISAATNGMNTFKYRCKISNACTSINSAEALLYIGINILTHPLNQEFCSTAGSSASFSVSTAALAPLAYQWQLSTNGGSAWANQANGAEYSGMTTATMNISTTTSGMHGYRYRCSMSNACETKNSIDATLVFVTTVSIITSQPKPDTVCSGTPATFIVATSGIETKTYTWQLSSNQGSSWTNQPNNSSYAGMTTATMIITSAAPGMNAYRYRCALGSVCGTTNTTDAALTVRMSISGNVTYRHHANLSVQPYPLYETGKTTKVMLFKIGNIAPIDSTVLQPDNTYSFHCILPLSYNLALKTNRGFSGVNATDALVISNHTVHQNGFSLTGIQKLAAQTRTLNSINSVDALNCRKRWVHIINSFPMGNWVFSTHEPTFDSLLNYYDPQLGILNKNTANTINLNDNITLNISALCVGDVNGSRISSFAKVTQLPIISGGVTAAAGQLVDVPFTLDKDITLAAFSLIIDFPGNGTEFYEVINVRQQTDSSELLYAHRDGKIFISWISTEPWNLNAHEPIVIVRLKAGQNLKSDQQIFPFGAISEIEFADENGKIIEGVNIILPILSSINEVYSFGLGTCFPNPMEQLAEIPYTIPSEGHVELSLYNVLGERVAMLVNKTLEAGNYSALLNRSGLSAGVYTYKLTFTNNLRQSTSEKTIVILTD